MDENMSRGYVLLLNKRNIFSKSFHYKKRKKVVNKRHASNQEEDEEYLQSSPLPQSSMGNSTSSSTDPSYFFQATPKDKCNLIYLGLLLAGVGFLLPYNSFVIAVDYFQSRYPGTTIIFDMSFVYILVAFGAVIVNNILVETISLYWRINFGYLLSIMTLLVIAIFEVGCESFPSEISYKLNLLAVAVVAFGCTIQQSSFYGYTSMLPSRYTQAVMTGESAAGLIVSINRILTKLILDDKQINTLLFFGISIAIVACCIITHNLLQRTTFVKFYINMCSLSTSTLTTIDGGTRRITENKPNIYANIFQDKFQQNDDLNLVDICEPNKDRMSSPNFGILSIGDTQTLQSESSNPKKKMKSQQKERFVAHSDSTEFDMPFGIDDEDLQNYSPPVLPEPSRNAHNSNNDSKNVVQAIKRSESLEFVINSDNQETDESLKQKSFALCSGLASNIPFNTYWCERIRNGFLVRWEVSKTIWPFMLSISSAYFVTLSLFPGIESEIINCNLRSWMPVVLMATFNFTDCIGKIVASFYYNLSAYQMMCFSCIRVFLIPLLLLCAAPRITPVFESELWSITFTTILGVTNGVVGSLPMILAPCYVTDDMKEITGNIMTLSYSVGLTTGSLAAYAFDYLLGAPLTDLDQKCLQNTNINATVH
ncbi:equilibrative nucleoside transporter 4-like protein [Leptotrombidium deliense]|uniref:Equilibrative nucleoside transporter 4-like protein n=1 Tax=Leptotrombidium deliense TaxID=299467 RepID=A0A443SEK2_9ACAR|nr:equilibrative nucleoside transporter 4-like protein [Leptotrombidium deliense]